MDRYRAGAVQVCQAQGVRVLRADTVLADLGPTAFAEDGLHLSARGYRVLLGALAETLRSV